MGVTTSTGRVIIEIDDLVREPKQIGALTATDQPGSISNSEVDGRQIYVFGWFEGDGPGVWRSAGGADAADDEKRLLFTFGLEKVADLTAGDFGLERSTENDIVVVRFRYEP